MQEAILTNVIHFAPIGILALLLIMVLILVANLRQTKKINKKLTDTLQKADDYFQYILEEEEAEEEEEIPEIRPVERKSLQRKSFSPQERAKKARKKPKMRCFYRTF